MVPEMVHMSATNVRAGDDDPTRHSSILADHRSVLMEEIKRNLNGSNYENGLFSSSLSDIFNKKLILSSSKNPLGESVENVKTSFEEDEPFESMEEMEAQTIGNLLPDDDDLLSGVIDDIPYVNQPNSSDDIDDDIFYPGGGMELEADAKPSDNKHSELFPGGSSCCQQGDLIRPFAGEHPLGEHPSRTLFVRNINSNVEDAELRLLFEQYGNIRTLYTACKHRGFVMISYYDIRSARNAMRALQNKPLRRRKLDIHFSIPKENPAEDDVNQGTLVVFNLDSSVSNDDLRQIFGVYGEIKEIRETPHKDHQRFIEFYDIRAADMALREINRNDVAGRKIKLECIRPQGTKHLVQQSLLDLDNEELNGDGHGSSCNSLLRNFGPNTLGAIASNGFENGVIKDLNGAARIPINAFLETRHPGLSSSVSQNLSAPLRITSVANRNNQVINGDFSHLLPHSNLGYQIIPSFHPQSVPEYHNGLSNGISLSSAMSPVGVNVNGPSGGADNRHLHKEGSGSLNGHSVNHNEGAYRVSGNGSFPLHGPQYSWNNSNIFHQHPAGGSVLSNSPKILNNGPSHLSPQIHGVPRALSHMPNTNLHLHHHVGSAPTVNPSLWDRRNPYARESQDHPAFHPGSLGSMGFSGSPRFNPLELVSSNAFLRAVGNHIDPPITPTHVGVSSPQQRMFHGRNHMFSMSGTFDSPSDRMRSRRYDLCANQADNKKQYELDIERIVRGEDSRTTLMIKNIPNKYTSKMLLAAIDENHRGTYDFIYLPIDFKNKCNVGYAFINMTDSQHIIPFYQSFNGKKWEKFNSEKVASLAYARIQGKAALIAHFQNSSLMNEDKRCRPILFHSDGPNAGDQEPFPMGSNIKSRSGRSRAASGSEENAEETETVQAMQQILPKTWNDKSYASWSANFKDQPAT